MLYLWAILLWLPIGIGIYLTLSTVIYSKKVTHKLMLEFMLLDMIIYSKEIDMYIEDIEEWKKSMLNYAINRGASKKDAEELLRRLLLIHKIV
jgi:hypothetical protein